MTIQNQKDAYGKMSVEFWSLFLLMRIGALRAKEQVKFAEHILNEPQALLHLAQCIILENANDERARGMLSLTKEQLGVDWKGIEAKAKKLMEEEKSPE